MSSNSNNDAYISSNLSANQRSTERYASTNERSIGEVIGEMKEEIKDFVATRLQMLKTEMNDKVSVYKTAVPALLIAGVMGVFAFALFTAAITAWIATAFESQYAVFFACAIVMIVYGAIAAGAAFFGIAQIRKNSLVPERTLRVLKQDQEMLQQQVADTKDDIRRTA